MKISPPRLKLKLKIKLFIDGKQYDGDEIITHIENIKSDLIREIFKVQSTQAETKTDAVEWTADLLKIDPATVWRAIKEITQN
ncbi:MAG: hypothetical protein CV087_24320 [Candidatus Brocadia sp. WS118]|nr:MAG: hypothetical protein CV087_24320 [Candidatus Brocadia sp. WS118]